MADWAHDRSREGTRKVLKVYGSGRYSHKESVPYNPLNVKGKTAVGASTAGGAAAGFAVGGPVGAVIGLLAGAIVGTLITGD